nr:hypothetical protein [Tanacetum cinerariifolium]
MNAKLVWLREKYKYRSQTHIGGSSSQTHEICDAYLTEKELHQLYLDEEALRETLEEEAIDEKERKEKISMVFSNFKFQQLLFQRLLFPYNVRFRKYRSRLTFGVPFSRDFLIGVSSTHHDFDLHLTPVLRPSSSTHVELSPSTPNPVRIIPDPAVIEDVGEDEVFKSEVWVSATDYVNANGGTFFSPKSSMRNVVTVFRKDTVPGSGSG